MPFPSERSHTPKGRLAYDRILTAAERLFAKNGFHGTGLRDVAVLAKLPLASIVYHFGKKERLYLAVLAGIARALGDAVDVAVGPAEVGATIATASRDAWDARVEGVVLGIVRWSADNPARVRFLLRELLDNPARVARASALPLAPVLERLSAVVAQGARLGVLSPGTPELAVLHLVGAISYVVVARPTVDRIVGAKRARALARAWESEAVAFGRKVMGLPRTTENRHGSTDTDPTREARPRARGAANDRPRAGVLAPADRRVHRRRKARA